MTRAPVPSPWPPAVAARLHRRSRIAVVIAPDALTSATELLALHGTAMPALRLDAAPADLLHAWTGVDPARDDVAASLLLAARNAAGIDAAAGPVTSLVERDWSWEASPAGPPIDSPLLRALLRHDTGHPSSDVRRALSDVATTRVECIGELSAIWGDAARAIVAVVADLSAWPPHDLAAIVHAAEVCPRLRLLVVTNEACWKEIRQRLDAHLLAVLEEGVTREAASSPTAIGQLRARAADAVLRATGGAGATGRRYSGDLCVEGVTSPESADMGHRSAEYGRPVAPSRGLSDSRTDAADQARSLAEALLFAALQADSRTAGLFRLNAPGGFAFGDREAEIDLLCDSCRVAIEVDGYFHFQDTAAYRRDRAKDFLMQRRGLFVLRFLAEDVVDRLEWIVERVAEVVSQRSTR